MIVPGWLIALVRLLAFWFFAFSMGGFVFYAGVVVPIGSDVVGTTTQGFVTQRVTNVLNFVTLAMLVGVFVDYGCCRRQRTTKVNGTIGICLAIMAVCLSLLFWLHPQLDAQLVEEDQVVVDSARFYTLHRVYLWSSTVQWLASLPLAWGIFLAAPCMHGQPSSSESS